MTKRYPLVILPFALAIAVVRNKVKYMQFKKKRHNTNPKRGPYHFRSPARIFWRTVSYATALEPVRDGVGATSTPIMVALKPVWCCYTIESGFIMLIKRLGAPALPLACCRVVRRLSCPPAPQVDVRTTVQVCIGVTYASIVGHLIL